MRQRLRIWSTEADLLMIQVANTQAAQTRAHTALLHWGAWSRSHKIGQTGNKPLLDKQRAWDLSKDTQPEAPRFYVSALEGTFKFTHPAGQCDPIEEDHGADLVRAEDVDVLIHLTEFEVDWRNVLRAIYFYTSLQAHQWPEAAKVKPHRFGHVFDAAMLNVHARLT